jgi:hypothetical protein
MVMAEFLHLPLNEEVTAIGGSYELVKEARLSFGEREVLYLVGHALFDTTCCGAGGCAYALVPGFVVRWKHGTSGDGLAVSQVEAVRDQAVQREVERIIRQQEPVHQVNFF